MRGEENPTPKREYAWQDGFAGSGNQNDELSMIKDIAGTDNLGEAASLRIVVNSRNTTISHLGRNLPNLIELNLSMSVMESIRDIGTGFHLLQASQTSCIQLQPCILSHENDLILLQVLWVPRCGLDSFDGISALPSLRELYASYNDIADLLPLSDCPDLEVIDIECNKVSDLDALEVLSSSCSSLQSLNLTGCPVTNLEGYRELVRMAIPTIISLDDAPIHTGNSTQTDGTCRVSTSLPPPFLPPKLSLFEDEIHLVQQGIKHARVGVDSHEFRELEIAIMVASSPAANPPHPPHIPLGVDDDTSTSNESTNQLTLEQLTAVASSSILPASASSWMRCSQQGSLPGMASLAQQQQQANERADRPSGIDSRGSTASIGSRPSIILLSAGGESGLIGGRSSASSMQRPSTNSRPFSARPNAASISNGRPPTSSYLLIGGPLGSSAPPTAGGGGGGQIGGLYWRKNRVNAVDHSSAGSQNGRRGSAQDEGEEDAASSLTFGGEAALVGGGLARDLRRRRNNQQGGGGGGGGQMNRGPSPPSSQGSLLDAFSRPSSVQGSKGGAHEGWVARRESSNEASTAPRQSNQENTGERIISLSKSFDSEALLQELRRWKVETADVALMPAENEEGDGGGISGAWQTTSDSQAEVAKADVLNFDTERSSPTFENPQVQGQSQDQSNRASSSDRIEVASGIKLSSINTTPILQGPSLRPSSALGRPPLLPVPSLLTSRTGSFKSLESNEEVKLFRPSTPSRNGLMMGLAPVLGARPARPSKMLLCKAILDAFPGRVVCKTTSSAAVWDQDGDQMDLIHSLSQKSRSLRGGREVDLKSLNPMPAKRNEDQTAGDSGEWI